MFEDATAVTVQLPDSNEPERIFVGACLAFGAKFVLRHSSTIGVGEVFNTDLAELYAACMTLAAGGRSVDPVTVRLAWSEISKGPLKLQLLGELPELAPCEAAGDEAAGQVVKLAAERRMALGLAAGLEALRDHKGVDAARAAVDSVEQTGRQDVMEYSAIELCRVLTQETERRFENQKELQGISTGFRGIDRRTEGLQAGELAVIGGRPSQGKTAFAVNVAGHVAMALKKPTLFVSLEMSAYHISRRLAACRGGFSLRAMKTGAMTHGDLERYSAFVQEMGRAPLHVAYSPGLDIGRLSLMIRRYKSQHDIEVVVVDYLQQLRPGGKHEKRTYEVGNVSTGLKAAAVRSGVAILAACQLSRGPESDGNRYPRLSDLADSAQIERDGDTIWLIHFADRQNEPEKARILVSKQRDGECGAVDLGWDGPHARFYDPQVSGY